MWIFSASAKLELVDKFCYLGDMLSVDGDADAAMEARDECPTAIVVLPPPNVGCKSAPMCMEVRPGL